MTELPAALTDAQHDCLLQCWQSARARAGRLCRQPLNRSGSTMIELVRQGYLVKVLTSRQWAMTNKGDHYISDYLRRATRERP